MVEEGEEGEEEGVVEEERGRARGGGGSGELEAYEPTMKTFPRQTKHRALPDKFNPDA